ncbi:MAG: glycerophosphodiester phosphodiesterase family protein [Candidatus Hydrogenedentes bacterium]|nr:glycerophosphodiester phosphodiesterase family protein [Candidatus Hydrogenedentota bacterium]
MTKLHVPILFLLMMISFRVVAESDVLPLKPPKQGGVYVVAHRGAHQDIPENTLAAYQKAIEIGVDFVEIDVRTTKDGKFVSVHNGEIDAYANGAAKGKVSDFTLEELRAIDIGIRLGPKWKGTQVPTFEEILDLCKGKVGIYLDLKQAPIPPLVEAIKVRGMEHDVIWYVGDGEVQELEQVCPECIPMPDPGPEANLPKLIADLKPRAIASMWKYCSPSFTEPCHKAGAIVVVDDGGPQTWEKLLEWGVDGIQTDEPAELVAVLKKREGEKK